MLIAKPGLEPFRLGAGEVSIVSVAPSEEIKNEAPSITRRRLILRDSLTFLSLTLVTVALFLVTLFLFRTFAAHRTELGRRWSDRGRAALTAGKPEQAIRALRTALSYTPGERTYELLLAQALAEGRHTDEAYLYFTGLWDTEPGDGFVNLQLARLASARKEQGQAVNFYRASIFGTWQGDGVLRRRNVRLELARYLLDRDDLPAARAELLIAEGNADNDPALDLELGRLFEQAGDRADALEAYRKAAEAGPVDPAPPAAAGRLAYSMGEFATAQKFLAQAVRAEQAVRAKGSLQQQSPAASPTSTDVTELLKNSERILAIFPSRRLSPERRVARLLDLKTVARKRLESCASSLPNGLPAELQELNAAWNSTGKATGKATRALLLGDENRQDDLLQLIYDTEVNADKRCGTATGDDALVVILSRHPGSVEK